MTQLAGRLELAQVMARLGQARPVFHSEADFQFAFALTTRELDPDLSIRLQVRAEHGPAEYTDLVCTGPDGKRTAIEFKYFTAAWQGTDSAVERFQLRNHAADDLARLHFVFDIERLERLCGNSEGRTTGIAIMLSNVAGLWNPPRVLSTRDRDYRLHEGRQLQGVLQWGDGDYPANRRELAGSYLMTWQTYAQLEGKNGQFRWLAVEIANTR